MTWVDFFQAPRCGGATKATRGSTKKVTTDTVRAGNKRSWRLTRQGVVWENTKGRHKGDRYTKQTNR